MQKSILIWILLFDLWKQEILVVHKIIEIVLPSTVIYNSIVTISFFRAPHCWGVWLKLRPILRAIIIAHSLHRFGRTFIILLFLRIHIKKSSNAAVSFHRIPLLFLYLTSGTTSRIGSLRFFQSILSPTIFSWSWSAIIWFLYLLSSRNFVCVQSQIIRHLSEG